MNVADALLRILKEHGVERIFGIPGDAINDVTDAIRRQDDIAFINVRHEEAGAFAASATAKLTGNLAVCVGTAGPGAIHLLNGLYDAKLDHAPVLAITGQVARGFIGTQAHQEVDLKALFSDVAVYSETVTTPDQAPEILIRACHAAIAHRGVAHVSIPTDVAGEACDFDGCRPLGPARPGRVTPTQDDCKAAAGMIDAAEKVVILAGIGCAGAHDDLLAFAEAAKAPIVRSLRAKDVIDDDHPLCIGGLGLLGGKPAVQAMDDCDLLVMAGTDFPYLDFYPASAKVIQIDIESTHIGRRVPVDLGLVGDAGGILAALGDAIAPGRDDQFLTRMQAGMQTWRDAQDKLETDSSTPIAPPMLMRAISDAAPDDTIFLADTGTSTAWTARHLRVRGDQRYTLSGGLATMAFACPGALGAQLAYPDRRVIAICGDGAFAMLMGDFVTAVKYRLPIVTVVLNNAKLGFIQLELEAKGLPDWGTNLTNPDFAAIAAACGGWGRQVTDPADLRPALDEAFAQEGPALLDVMVDPDALIMPPKITLGMAARFGMSRLREALGT
ncbi:pyruvate oxidase [Roseovarius sp. MBR-78]|uniref:thiamine pyrophosphate-dependent enzyme n=1 Tax=Roseovarius sp. MBR-78 TaxID=3156460 RepID=UPI00339360B4